MAQGSVLTSWMPGSFWNTGDPRVRPYPLMSNPIGILFIIAFYLFFSLKLGPAFMKNRRPFNITLLIVVYNVAMVASSLYFIFLTVKWAYVKSGYNIVCQENDSQTNPAASIIIYHGWCYLVLKISELLDTVFFVLRKKSTHVSFLHLLHHSLALWTVWLDLHLAITGQVALFPLLNASVHTVMYTYYGLAALGLQKYLWWKKYVTQFQIAQFATLTVHSAIPLFVNCGFPKTFAVFMVMEAALFMGLFSDFYYRTYVRSSVRRKMEGKETHIRKRRLPASNRERPILQSPLTKLEGRTG